MNRTGFTIIELVIVVAIIALISGMVGIRFLQTNAQHAVKNTALNVSSGLDEARSRAVSGQTSGGGSSWGVYVDLAAKPQAVLFVDVDGDEVYTVADTSEEIELDDATSLTDCKINSTSLTTCGVLYAAPSGSASLFTSGVAPTSPLTSLEIDLQSTANTDVIANVNVTAPSGLVTTSVSL